MDERRMVDQILEWPSWLRQRDLEFVKSVFQQLEARSRAKMSKRQAEAIRNMSDGTRIRSRASFKAVRLAMAGADRVQVESCRRLEPEIRHP